MDSKKITSAERIEEIEILKRLPLLSKRQYKVLSGLSEPTITRLVLTGVLPSRRIGRSVRILNDLMPTGATQ
jgi:hypothetical protein